MVVQPEVKRWNGDHGTHENPDASQALLARVKNHRCLHYDVYLSRNRFTTMIEGYQDRRIYCQMVEYKNTRFMYLALRDQMSLIKHWSHSWLTRPHLTNN